MPELPEVETIARFLDKATAGLAMESIKFFRKDLREPIPIAKFRRVMEGQSLTRVARRSKYLVFETGQGAGLVHLGMTGQLLLRPGGEPERPHTHLVATLVGPGRAPSYLHFIDPRRFGRIGVHPGPDWQAHPFMKDLGREPLAAGDLASYLYTTSRGRRVPIKNFLMDGKIVVGVGNIYACEALFRAGIDPQRAALDLSLADFQALATAIRQTLRAAIKAGGTTFRDYKDANGKPGYFAVALQVYGRKEGDCRQCGNTIAMIRQAGRSTWFCAFCQK